MRKNILTNNKIYTIAEIGINHNGDINLAKKMIKQSKDLGFSSVKFQKRFPEQCVPENKRGQIRTTPWGEMTYLEYKKKTEFNKKEYDHIDKYCKKQKIKWFCSVWDLDSVDFMKQYCSITKIPSALIVDEKLCKKARQENTELIISTGMSTEKEIEQAISWCDPDIIMHTNSTYPSPLNQINIRYISWLQSKYKNKIIGYSGHELGLMPTIHAVAIGAKYVERHITLDKELWGSDHKASLEPKELNELVAFIREIEASAGEGGPRTLLQGEKDKLKSLRG